MIDAHMTAEILVTFGGLFLIGLLADLIGRYTPLPRVTLLLLAGFLIGPSVLNWLPQFIESWFPLLTVAEILSGHGGTGEALALGAWEIGGAIILGLILGTRLGGWLSGADTLTRRWIGLALLPQAGVAIGMALLASQHFPELKDTILPVVLASTVIFELLGPVVTRRVLVRMGEVKNA